jgi:Ser/Thr protein kinase RdoA (MazF antagonist)
MNIFPTQYSTLSSVALKHCIENSYGLINITCRLLLRGVSDTYIIETTSAKYVFRIYRKPHRTLEEIKGEVELLNILKEQGAKVSYPINDSRGEQIQEFNAAEGMRYGVLFSFAPGQSSYNLTDDQLKVLGDEMAFNHNITSQIELKHKRKDYNIETTITRPLEISKPDFKDFPEGHAYLTETASYVIGKLDQLGAHHFSYGYCQFDYLPKNFHFDENNSITLFDFDFAGKGFLASDIASFSAHLFLNVQYKRMTLDDARSSLKVFLDAYRKTRPLSDQEIKALPCLGFMWWIFYLGFHHDSFDDFSNFFYSTRFLKERVATIKEYFIVMDQMTVGLNL